MRQSMLNKIAAVTSHMINLIAVCSMLLISQTSLAESHQAAATGAFNPELFPDEHCLALNIYFEARGSNMADKLAVADVVLNRVRDNRFPDTICEVVYQGKQKPSWKDETKMVMVRHKCQFSWYCDGKPDDPKNLDLWNEAKMLAWRISKFGDFRGITEGATHYHATYVNPEWARTLQQVGRIGAHIFYRWE
mgnify:CR=1 FL=1